MIAKPHPVEHCADFPFSIVESDEWICTVHDEARDLGPRRVNGHWMPAPSWCPLRVGDPIVTLRVP